MTYIFILSSLLAWFLLGVLVLSSIDDDEQRLYKWAAAAPFPLLYELIVCLWPVVVWKRWREGQFKRAP